LRHTNQWIFASKNLVQITAVCNSSTELFELQNSSLLTLQDDCTLKHHTATIQTHRIYTDTLYESHIAFGDLTSNNSSETRIIIDGSPIDISNELQQLRQLRETIKNDKIIELPKLVSQESVHHYITSYAALFLIFCTIIWLVWKLRKIKQSRILHSEPTPTVAPRFKLDPELNT